MAPFPYFGGKAKIAHVVWDALDQPKHYIEPFFGSGAVLLNRPDYNPGKHTESVNDKDGFIANIWRALQHDPDAVAKVCDWPVNHADLAARKMSMIAHEQKLIENLIADAEYYDVKLAGYWIWAASCWIGSGLTRIGQIPHICDAGKCINGIGKRPHISNAGMCINGIGQRPHISNAGKCINGIGQRPHISNSGMGIHGIGKIPHISNAGMGEPFNTHLYTWFRALQERLRYVRVVCGDWTRVCGGEWQDKIGDVGIFFDPPYGVEDRDTTIYAHDGTDIAAGVMDWCKERGRRETYRIVIAGYEEYAELVENYGWTAKKWKAQGGYSKSDEQNPNRHRETLYMSPHCQRHKGLFDEATS